MAVQRLERWLGERAGQVRGLQQEDPGAAHQALQLAQALEEAREFQQLAANLQVGQENIEFSWVNT